MPNKVDLEALRLELERQLAQARNRVQEDRALAASEREHNEFREVMDQGDEAVAIEQAASDAALLDRHVQDERSLQAALLRVADNSYGRCVDCDEDIDPARLRIYPACKRCQACQTIHERTRVGPARSSL